MNRALQSRAGIGHAKKRQCPCGVRGVASEGAPTMAIVLQLATVGLPARYRVKATTLHMCDNCVRYLMSKRGRELRRALVTAVQMMAVKLAREVEKKPRARA